MAYWEVPRSVAVRAGLALPPLDGDYVVRHPVSRGHLLPRSELEAALQGSDAWAIRCSLELDGHLLGAELVLVQLCAPI